MPAGVTPLAGTYRTLLELRTQLQNRLGMGAQGAAPGINIGNLNSILYENQVVLYEEFDWHTLIGYTDITVGIGQINADYPTWMHPERLLQIGVKVSNTWIPVRRGIEINMYTTQASSPSFPRRFEQYSQIEFWPAADQAYTVRIWGIAKLAAFLQDTDRCTIDDSYVFLTSLAVAKAHYKQADAVLIGNLAEKLRGKLRSKSWKQDVFNPNMGNKVTMADDPIAKPITTSTLGY